MSEIVGCIGDLLVEIMRKRIDEPLGEPGEFVGPYPSGASGIFIDTIARLGVNARFIGAVGHDDFGKLIINRLKRDGVDISHIKVLNNDTTGVAFVTYRSDGSRQFIYHLSKAATGQIYPEDIDPEYISDIDYLHVVGSTMSINEHSAKACMKAINIVKEAGGKISFDPNFRPELISKDEVQRLFNPLMSKSDIIFPTKEEVKVLTDEKDIKDASQKLLDIGDIRIVAIKRGKEGSSIFTREERIDTPSFEVEEVDPTGAGDSYCAGFLFGLIKGMDLKEIGRFANAVGALAVTKKGPMEGAPYFKDVKRLME